MAQQVRALAGLVEGPDWSNGQPSDGSLQQFVTPVPGDPSHSSDLTGYHTYPQYTNIHVGETLMHKKEKCERWEK